MFLGRSNGILEILLVLLIILLLFGPKRITNVAKELGKSIAAFRDGLTTRSEETGGDSEKNDPTDSPRE